MAISKIWAHAWIDYLLYDTELYYTFVKNRNYELPDPPIDYNFKSTKSDPVLMVNLHHAFIIRAFHTAHDVNNASGLLKERDWRLLQKAVKNDLDEILLSLLERQVSKMIMKIIKDPTHWKAWLQLFDDENIYEETLTSDERRESAFQTPNITFDMSNKVSEDPPISSKREFYTIEETAREYLPDSPESPRFNAGQTDAEFVLKVSPSEQFELEDAAVSKRDKKKSQVPPLKMDESLITDQDSQIFSPRVPGLTIPGLYTPTSSYHKKSVSLNESNTPLLDLIGPFRSARGPKPK